MGAAMCRVGGANSSNEDASNLSDKENVATSRELGAWAVNLVSREPTVIHASSSESSVKCHQEKEEENKGGRVFATCAWGNKNERDQDAQKPPPPLRDVTPAQPQQQPPRVAMPHCVIASKQPPPPPPAAAAAAAARAAPAPAAMMQQQQFSQLQ